MQISQDSALCAIKRNQMSAAVEILPNAHNLQYSPTSSIVCYKFSCSRFCILVQISMQPIRYWMNSMCLFDGALQKTLRYFSCRVGLALLKTAEDELLALPFEQLLAALNSKRFPAFSKSPGQLMKVAMAIKVSRRLAVSSGEYQVAKGRVPCTRGIPCCQAVWLHF